MNITKDVVYVGVSDRKIDLFEGQYQVKRGMAYNSYLIIDEKTAVMDSVDIGFGEEWIANIKSALAEREPDYLVVQHMEPDHSANIIRFMEAFPNAKIVSSAKSFVMIKNFFDKSFGERELSVGEGDTLSLGNHKLTFITAPMVHWPEVIVSYDSFDKILFSADGFGKFGAYDIEEDWADEARRYYIGIVGKYGAQVQNLLKKAARLDIDIICPLHGPVLRENLDYYINLYNTWSSYQPEEDGVVIAYASVYGNTEKAARALADELNSKTKVVLHDLTRCDMAMAVADAFKYSKLVLASVTYNADVFPPMREFIHNLIERNFSNRKVGIIENGSWAPMAAKVIRGMLEASKNISFTESSVKILSALKENNKNEINALANELLNN
ncbi:MAG: FprA family A-type flavoprotein [Clostridia bacterium]|nr:FprA family A-type flavoprotein [Clostridia bacterium]